MEATKSCCKTQDAPQARSGFDFKQWVQDKVVPYQPLFLIFAMTVGFAVIQADAPADIMRLWMGYFLSFLALFKLFDVSGFADGFQTYDLVAKRWRGYALIYPFIELGLGIAFLMSLAPLTTNVVMLIVMGVGSIGVLKSILSGQKIKCACLGTVLNVPLSTISVIETLGMSAMAAYNILRIL